MLGLLTLGLTVVMIYKLVRNALVGKQLNADAKLNSTIDLIIPVGETSEFYVEPWLAALKSFKVLSSNLRIHVLVEGPHSSLHPWQELQKSFPMVEVQGFLIRPIDSQAIPWMIEQVTPKIQGQVVIVGDPELVPTESAILSLANFVTEKQKSYFVLPQTSKSTVLGEAIAILNPTLALASIFGFRKFRRNISHPLLGVAKGWMGMSLKTFQELNFTHVQVKTWKESILKQWDREYKDYDLAFGEKHLLRYYPENFSIHVQQMNSFWQTLWTGTNPRGFWLYILALFVWSFPILFFFSHPFWSIASVGLLILYRIFTKIVFQESWTSIILHPFACLMWIGTLFYWIGLGLKTKFRSQGPVKS